MQITAGTQIEYVCWKRKHMKKSIIPKEKKHIFIPIVTSLVLRLLIGCSWKQLPSISQYWTRPTITDLSNSSWLKNLPSLGV